MFTIGVLTILPESLPSILKQLPKDVDVSTSELEELIGEEEVIDYHIAKDLPKDTESQFKSVIEDLIVEIYFLTKKSILSYEIRSDCRIYHIVPLDDVKLMSLYEEKDLLTISLIATSYFLIFGVPKDINKIKGFFKALRNLMEM